MATDNVDYGFPVSVIGAGCICSNLVPFLLRLGLRDVTVYDPDIVEEHNLNNQIYRPKDIGRKKVVALAEIISETFGFRITPVDQRVTKQEFDGVVICGVDSMKSRRLIWEQSIKFQPQITLYFEARIGGPTVKVYCIIPTDLEMISCYEENLHDDQSAVRPECARGEIPTIATVVAIITRYLHDFASGQLLPKETILDVSHWLTLTQ